MTSSESPQDRNGVWRALSALHDGEADDAQRSLACDAWRQDADVRATWHAWQLAADVLRSDDLASDAAHDAAFLRRLRLRLQDEPTVLAPSRPEEQLIAVAAAQEPSVPQWRRWHSAGAGRWAAPAAVAAGFMVVAGALVVLRAGDPGPAARGATLAGLTSAPATQQGASEPTSVGHLMQRNPELDRYLAAHRQFAQGPALAAPGGLRQVVVTPDAR